MKKKYFFITLIIFLLIVYLWDNSFLSFRAEKRMLYSVLKKADIRFDTIETSVNQSTKRIIYTLGDSVKENKEEYFRIVKAFNDYLDENPQYKEWNISVRFETLGNMPLAEVSNYYDIEEKNFGTLRCFYPSQYLFGSLSEIKVLSELDFAVIDISYDIQLDDVSVFEEFSGLQYIYGAKYLSNEQKECIQNKLPNCIIQ